MTLKKAYLTDSVDHHVAHRIFYTLLTNRVARDAGPTR